jgi:isopentenyldiphosphate isomerase
VHVLMFNSKGEIFLQKRSRKKDTFPGAWDSSAAGHLNAGEEYDACAHREVREELGYEMKRAPERVMRIEACEDTGQEFVWVYRHECEGPFQLCPEEIESGAWHEPRQVAEWMRARPGEFAPSFIRIWRALYPDYFKEEPICLPE